MAGCGGGGRTTAWPLWGRPHLRLPWAPGGGRCCDLLHTLDLRCTPLASEHGEMLAQQLPRSLRSLRSLRLGENDADLSGLLAPPAPLPPLLRELRENGLGTPQAHLSLTLGSGGDTAELDYGYRDYAMGGELLVRDNLPFDRDDVILLGTLFMRGRYVEFDLQRRTLGLAQLQGTTPCPEGGCPAPVVRTQRPR